MNCHPPIQKTDPAPPTYRTPTPVPSPTILSLLAALPQPSERDLDLDFLLPPLPPSPSSTDPAHLSTRRRRAGAPRSRTALSVPPKWVQAPDGHWYPATAWSLHGRHPEPVSVRDASLPSPTKFVPPQGDLIRPSAEETATAGVDLNAGYDPEGYSTSYALPESTLIAEYNGIEASLPTGWKPATPRSKFYDIPVIVVVSLILAIVVTLVITGCVLGHKTGTSAKRSKRRKHNLGAEEKTLESDGETITNVKMRRRKEKMWETWRRQAAKIGLRRRVRKAAAFPSTKDVAVAVDDDERTPCTSIASMRTVASNSSLRTIFTVQPDCERSVVHSVSATTEASVPSPASPATTSPPVGSISSNMPPPPPPTPSMPPAYRRSRARPKSNLTTTTKPSHIAIPIPTSPSHVSVPIDMQMSLPHDDNDHQAEYFQQGDEGEADSELDHDDDDHDAPFRAHIATDDKATLERMRRGVSMPMPTLHDRNAESGMHELETGLEAVVPEWVDEQVEDFGFGDISSPHSPSHPVSHSQSQQQCDPGSSTSSGLSPHQHQHSYSHPLIPPPPRGTHLHRHLDVGTTELEGDGALPYYVPRFLRKVLNMGEEDEVLLARSAKSDISADIGGISSPSAPPLEVGPSAPPIELDMGMDADMRGARPSAPPVEEEDASEEDGENPGEDQEPISRSQPRRQELHPSQLDEEEEDEAQYNNERHPSTRRNLPPEFEPKPESDSERPRRMLPRYEP